MNRHLISSLPLRRDGEFAVNTRLFHPFIANPMLSYEKWIESLFHMTNSRGLPRRFRLMAGANGDIFLNEDLASYSAQLVAFDVVGAIALVIIHEGAEAASAGDPDFANRKFNAYKSFTPSNGLVRAEVLHSFLEVGGLFDDWLRALKQRHVMHYGADYVRLHLNARGKTVNHRRDTGMGHVIFRHRFAFKVAAAEPTHIGSLMKLCMMNFYRDQ